MKRAVAGLVLAASLLAAGPARAYHDDGDRYGRDNGDGYYRDGGDCDSNGDCGEHDYRQDYGSYDRNRNRGRNRGAFSPGPFDRSPLDFRNACISLDCSNRDKRDDQQRRDDDRDRRADEPMATESLFPPSPEGIKNFVVSTAKSSIELGRLFAETTITFVENLMIGIA